MPGIVRKVLIVSIQRTQPLDLLERDGSVGFPGGIRKKSGNTRGHCALKNGCPGRHAKLILKVCTMAALNDVAMWEVKENIKRQIRSAWKNLEVAKQTLKQAEDLTARYRALLGCGPGSETQAKQR